MQIDTGTDQLLASVEDGVGWLTFNRPSRHNALSAAMRTAAIETVTKLDTDPGVRAVVLRGGGDRAFVSGADISEFDQDGGDEDATDRRERLSEEFYEAFERVSKPIIAMISGYCLGGGLMLALSADIRRCSDESRFGIPAVKLGRGASLRGVEQLRRVVNATWAAEILYTGRRLDAGEALQCGLVSRVLPAAELEADVRALAATIATNAPMSVATCKAAVREAEKDRVDQDVAAMKRMHRACLDSEDFAEGKRAFAEKRPANFRGV